MAVKKTTKKSSASAPKAKAAPKKAAAKTSAPKKAAGAKKSAPKKKAAAKKAAPVKLTDKQHDLLKSVHSKKDLGYAAESKSLAKSLEQLKDKKLVKKGAKNKETGHVHYHISKAGEKHVASSSTASA